MAILQTGARLIPGIDTIIETTEMDPTWGRWDINRTYVMGTQLDPAAQDAGNTGNTDILRPGLLMTYDGVTQLAKELNPAAPAVYGVLLYAEHVTGAGNKAKWFGYVLVGGQIRADGVIVPGQANYGLSEDAINEAAIRTELDKRFIVDDFRDNL